MLSCQPNNSQYLSGEMVSQSVAAHSEGDMFLSVHRMKHTATSTEHHALIPSLVGFCIFCSRFIRTVRYKHYSAES